MKNPCYRCGRRSAECHSRCEDYKSWKEWLDERNDGIRKERKLEQELLDAPFKALERTRK